jgi:hypothetical protein
MKICIMSGEAFPIYEIQSREIGDEGIIEVDQETLERWRVAFENFSKAQEEIVEHLETQGFKDQVWSANGIWYGYHI